MTAESRNDQRNTVSAIYTNTSAPTSVAKILAAVVALITFLTALSGCATFHTRMFEQKYDTPVCTDEFCFVPRIVAYKDVFGQQPLGKEAHGFWTTIKVYDTSIDASVYLSDDKADEIDQDERNRLGNEFKKRILGMLRMDSLALRIPSSEQVTVYPDTTKYEPRDVNYLTYFFGRVSIAPSVDELDAVFFYTVSPTVAGDAAPHLDSLVYPMWRVEKSSLPSGIDFVVGAIKGDDSTKTDENQSLRR